VARFKPICLLLFAVYAATPASGDALFTVNFDDLDASAGDLDLGGVSPYHDFTWSNFFAYTSTPGFPGFNNGIVSLDNAAFSGGEIFGAATIPIVGTITAVSPFDFISGYLGAGYYDNLDVTAEGFRGGTMLFSKTVTVGTGGAQLFNFGFTGIDQLDFFGAQTSSINDPFNCGAFNCTQFTLDDATFNTSSSTSPVPEPPAVSLLALAVFGLLAARRRTAGTDRRPMR
jgi:MYXO-CTERM domain-containing protein